MPKLAKIRRRRKAAEEKSPKRNPPLGTDVVEFIAPGFAAFAATRILTRVAAVQIAKRYPQHAKHAGAAATAATFAVAWFGTHRVKMLEKYHDAIVVGSGLATLQSLIQFYFPGIGKALDVVPAAASTPALPAGTTAQMMTSASSPQTTARTAPQSAQPPIPDGFKEVDANTWYSYNDAFDAGAYKGAHKAPAAPMVSTMAPDDDQIDALLEDGLS